MQSNPTLIKASGSSEGIKGDTSVVVPRYCLAMGMFTNYSICVSIPTVSVYRPVYTREILSIVKI